MKTTYYILALALLTLSFSCKNKTSKESTDTRNPMNEELTDTRNYEKDGNFEEDVYTYEEKTGDIDQNWNLNDPERQMRLYEQFELSEEQQQLYETALANWMTSNTENPYKNLSANDRIDAEADILENILDTEQFNRYKEWANANDKR
ncbi:hypothetical protein [Winogradskyella thalassocola]|uniref:Uncharacterized protein n=1 Tax=Winogradskyella thalassocola TaxID=262004 RepID=A0A1G8B7Q5_9FLAO|nr:hypothetical protein [Winogradskyella thalassocola]SDH29171.1 hypothetical protein SAMN04489796_102157 [Winogradskyella thalassocola]